MMCIIHGNVLKDINKLKLDISQQVEYLEGLGIRFEIFQKSQAIAFLTHNELLFQNQILC